MDLIPPHGGVAEPINRTVANLETTALSGEIPISDADLSTLYRIGDGGLSPAHRADGEGGIRPRSRRGSHRSQRQEVRLDDPARVPGRPPRRPRNSRPADVDPLIERRQAESSARSTSATSIRGTRAKYNTSVYGTPRERSSRRAHRQQRPANVPRRRRGAGAAAAEEPGVRRPRPDAARDASAVREEGLAARRRLPDAQRAAPGPRIRPGRRPRTAHARRALRRGRAQPARRRDQERRRRRRHAHADLPGAHRQQGARRRATPTRSCGRRSAARSSTTCMLLGLDIKMFYARAEGSDHARASTGRTSASPTSSSAASTPTPRTTTARTSGTAWRPSGSSTS